LVLPPESSIAVFRVFQEALTNVARHAEASTVSISLIANSAQVRLQIDDDGKGISPQAIGDPRSLGLVGMLERASALGGRVSFEPRTPKGTRVTLQLPLTEPARAAEGI
jgi:signal transduction histidine kinase